MVGGMLVTESWNQCSTLLYMTCRTRLTNDLNKGLVITSCKQNAKFSQTHVTGVNAVSGYYLFTTSSPKFDIDSQSQIKTM
jgi:hypothetical protein